jgi:hypothetical protein
MQGRYTHPNLKVEDGHFVYFFANGLKESEGYFTVKVPKPAFGSAGIGKVK